MERCVVWSHDLGTFTCDLSTLALVNILKFFVASEDHLLPQVNVFSVADEVGHCEGVRLCSISHTHSQVIKIFNLFITYGDTFLPNPTTYDELYYELIRVHKVFNDLHSLSKRHICSCPLHVCTCSLISSASCD